MVKSKKIEKIRLDTRMLNLGLAETLQQAQSFIMAGQVLVDEQRRDKPGYLVKLSETIRIKDLRRFVSRGGEKLWGAVQEFDIKDLFRDATVIDCGSSTGGFTDCALQLGAKKVYAVDIGFNQLAWSLRTDNRVVVMEGVDIGQQVQVLDENISLVLADISFNSLATLLPAICKAAPSQNVSFVLLVKPQFELGSGLVPEGGVVFAEESRQEALAMVTAAIEKVGLQFLKSSDSRLTGRQGNREIFLLARTP